MYSLYNISFGPFYESIFIGIYSLVLYALLKILIINVPYAFVLFILGVAKHFLGYFGGLQTYYCQVYNNDQSVAMVPSTLDLIIEGLLYVFFGMSLLYIVKNKYIIAFLTGVVIHLGFEILGLHKYFLRTHCTPFNLSNADYI
jgi:hypothetical protein